MLASNYLGVRVGWRWWCRVGWWSRHGLFFIGEGKERVEFLNNLNNRN